MRHVPSLLRQFGAVVAAPLLASISEPGVHLDSKNRSAPDWSGQNDLFPPVGLDQRQCLGRSEITNRTESLAWYALARLAARLGRDMGLREARNQRRKSGLR